MTDVLEIGSGNNANIVIANAMPPIAVTDVQTQGPPGPPGGKGDAGSLAIGTVTTGAAGSSASATITGDAPSQILNLTIPRGNVGDPTAYDLRGTGMPNGVVTANPGTYYTDTAGTNGAWRWLKKSGTGNTGWDVVYGDTEWRYVTSLLAPYWDQSLSTLHIRRVGGQVFVRGTIRTNAAITGNRDQLRSLTQNLWPNEFGYGSWFGGASIGLVTINNQPGTAANMAGVNDIGVRIPPGATSYGSWAPGDTVHFNFSYCTRAAWPPTLPGNPA